MPNFVNVFRGLDCPYEKKSPCPDRRTIEVAWGGGEALGKQVLLGNGKNDSDLYTSLVISFAISG